MVSYINIDDRNRYDFRTATYDEEERVHLVHCAFCGYSGNRGILFEIKKVNGVIIRCNEVIKKGPKNQWAVGSISKEEVDKIVLWDIRCPVCNSKALLND
jgi:hypothetical protein